MKGVITKENFLQWMKEGFVRKQEDKCVFISKNAQKRILGWIIEGFLLWPIFHLIDFVKKGK